MISRVVTFLKPAVGSFGVEIEQGSIAAKSYVRRALSIALYWWKMVSTVLYVPTSLLIYTFVVPAGIIRSGPKFAGAANVTPLIISA